MIDKNHTLLIVDDNEEILFILNDTLAEYFQVIEANCGMQALELLKKNNIDLIVSDVMMPEMDGYELCEKIKTNYVFSHIPIILLTAKNTIQSKIQGLSAGADVYIEKPFSMEFLLAQIQSLLLNRGKIKSYYSTTANISTIGNDADKPFLEILEQHILENMSNPELDVQHLAHYFNMSRTSLYRKISAVSSLSPLEIINLTRIKKAAEILRTQDIRLNEIIEIIGYSSVTQLGRNFQKYFGLSPSEYVKKNSINTTNSHS